VLLTELGGESREPVRPSACEHDLGASLAQDPGESPAETGRRACHHRHAAGQVEQPVASFHPGYSCVPRPLTPRLSPAGRANIAAMVRKAQALDWLNRMRLPDGSRNAQSLTP